MFYNKVAYITFILSSTNQHGVHSPFVYQLVTKCFYDATRYPAYKALERIRHYNGKPSQSKHLKFLFRLSQYLQLKHIATDAMVAEVNALQLASKTSVVTDLSTFEFPVSHVNQYQSTHFDAIFFSTMPSKHNVLILLERLTHHLHNDSVIICNNIHQSKNSEATWKFLYNSPNVTVSIDTFYFGLAFFRQQQPKQHFKIRM